MNDGSGSFPELKVAKKVVNFSVFGERMGWNFLFVCVMFEILIHLLTFQYNLNDISKLWIKKRRIRIQNK